MRDQPKKLKVAIVREQYVALTGDWKAAIVLNQFLYWMERTYDYDTFIEEERKRDQESSLEPTNGWIYKSASEMIDETMMDVSEATMLRYIDKLVDQGFLERRRNPKYKWDRTWQYRIDLYNVQLGLLQLGYPLDGYPTLPAVKDASFKMQHASFKMKDGSFKIEDRNHENERALPEIPSEITSETTTENLAAKAAGVPPSVPLEKGSLKEGNHQPGNQALEVDISPGSKILLYPNPDCEKEVEVRSLEVDSLACPHCKVPLRVLEDGVPYGRAAVAKRTLGNLLDDCPTPLRLFPYLVSERGEILTAWRGEFQGVLLEALQWCLQKYVKEGMPHRYCVRNAMVFYRKKVSAMQGDSLPSQDKVVLPSDFLETVPEWMRTPTPTVKEEDNEGTWFVDGFWDTVKEISAELELERVQANGDN